MWQAVWQALCVEMRETPELQQWGAWRDRDHDPAELIELAPCVQGKMRGPEVDIPRTAPLCILRS